MKKNILIFILGGIFFSCISVYATFSYSASQINYKTTTLDLALDELYTTQNTTINNLNNRTISTGAPYTSESLGDLTTSRSTTINNLPVGKFMVLLVSTLQGINSTSSIGDVNVSVGVSDSVLGLTCTNCTKTKIDSKYYHPVASAENSSKIASSQKLHSQNHITIYMVDIISSTNSLTATKTSTWEATWSPEQVSIHAIPLSIS